jgi:hypothetical protein
MNALPTETMTTGDDGPDVVERDRMAGMSGEAGSGHRHEQGVEYGLLSRFDRGREQHIEIFGGDGRGRWRRAERDRIIP